MTDTKTMWDEVGSNLAGLGLKLQLHLEQAGGEPEAPKELQDALHQIGTTVESSFSALANAVRDTSVHEDIAKVAHSLADALVTTLTEAGQELTKAVKSAAEHSGSEPSEHRES